MPATIDSPRETTIGNLLRDSVVYALGILVSRLAGFIMIPVYTRVLTPADYAVLETISRLVDVFGLILSLGLAGAFLRYYSDAKAAGESRALASSTLILTTVVTVIGLVVLLPVTPLLTRLTFGDVHHDGLVRLCLVGTLLSSFVSLPLTMFRAEGRAWRFTTFSLLYLFTALVLNVVLVVYLRLGVFGVMLSSLISAILWGGLLVILVVRSVGISFETTWARRLLAYGAPLVPALMAQFTLHFSDRFFLVRYASIDDLGLYSLGYRFAMLVTVFHSILDYAWWPWAFRVAATPGRDRQLREGGAFVLATSAVICAGVILFSGPVIRLVAAAPFWDAARYVPPLAVAYWLFTAQAPLSLGARLAKRTDVFALANVVAASMCLALSAWLIPRYQTAGAVGVTLASFAILAGCVAYGSHLVRPLAHRWSVAFVSLTALVVVAAVSRVTLFTPAIDVVFRTILWLGISVCLVGWVVPVPFLVPALRRLGAVRRVGATT
jgi:O-antigen/teichoic acid export membrane protein